MGCIHELCDVMLAVTRAKVSKSYHTAPILALSLAAHILILNVEGLEGIS
jgi:hypothetical protein